jgi:hypothetical protein
VTETEVSANQEFGLIVLEQGKPQQALAKFLNLLLNYQYGFTACRSWWRPT